MKDLGHGANVDLMAKTFNKNTEDIIDFSSNINPKVVPNLEKYILEGLNKCKSYPDINYTSLRKNIGHYININPDFIIPGNGATEIIYLLMKNIKKRLAILNPTFSEYERGAKLNNLEIETKEDFTNSLPTEVNLLLELITKVGFIRSLPNTFINGLLSVIFILLFW